MSRPVEELLRSGAAAARRAPSPALRVRLRTRLSDAPAPFGGGAGHDGWRARVKSAIAAGGVLAAGFWVVAVVGALRDPPRGAGGASSAGLATLDPGSPGAPGDLGIDLGRWTPGRLSLAVDGSLLDELGRIEEDASRAARFLVGRLPAPLASTSRRDSPR